MISVLIDEFRFEHPAPREPTWKHLCERWYQLDAAAYGVTEAYSVFRASNRLVKSPDWIFAASPGASNETDFVFARGGAISPAKFVHTLPNVRLSPLSQVMGWKGPTLCLQNDPSTVVSGLLEAGELALSEKNTVWVLSVEVDPAPPAYLVRSHFLDPAGIGPYFFRVNEKAPVDRPLSADRDYFRWLLSPKKESFALGGQIEIFYEKVRLGKAIACLYSI